MGVVVVQLLTESAIVVGSSLKIKNGTEFRLEFRRNVGNRVLRSTLGFLFLPYYIRGTTWSCKKVLLSDVILQTIFADGSKNTLLVYLNYVYLSLLRCCVLRLYICVVVKGPCECPNIIKIDVYIIQLLRPSWDRGTGVWLKTPRLWVQFHFRSLVTRQKRRANAWNTRFPLATPCMRDTVWS